MEDKERIEKVKEIIKDGIKYGFKIVPHTMRTALDWKDEDL